MADNDQELNRENSSHDAKFKTFPIVFDPAYDITMWGLEKVHPFDTCRASKIARFLRKKCENIHKFCEPGEAATDEVLLQVHEQEFLDDLYRSKKTIVMTSEVCLFYLISRQAINERLLRPMRCQVSGTLKACSVALQSGAAVNLGGGFHHCSSRKSGGFCFFADITLAVRHVWATFKDANILILDCDAHQGNGYARDVLFRMTPVEKSRIYILDLYNPRIYPRDIQAQDAIDREVHLPVRVQDGEYLKLLRYHLEAVISIDKFQPQFVIYNAGSDILEDDPLGKLSITPAGLCQRDDLVFRFAQQNNIPLVMLLSGGYGRDSWRAVAHSIYSLIQNGYLNSFE